MTLVEHQKSKKLSTGEIIMKSSLVGVIIAIPTVVAFLTVWSLSNDLLYGAITGLVVNFIAMGVSFKIVKIFFIKDQSRDSEFL
tara:strand:- start:17814 stop:18065 length:252 start_codon:yes stop_codon:yes gene_type:complete